jgi:hypothetical protein
VRRGGACRRGVGPLSGRGGGLSLAAKPPLQGAFAGQWGRVVGIGQTHADVAGPPVGVLLTQRQGLGQEGVGVVGGASRTGSVVRFEALGLALEAEGEELDGPWAEMQGACDGGSVLALGESALDAASEGQRQGSRHDDPRWNGMGIPVAYCPAAQRKTFMSGLSAKPTVGRQGWCSLPAARSSRSCPCASRAGSGPCT